MQRRDLLKMGGAAALAAGLPSGARAIPDTGAPLTPLNVSAAREMRTVVGLRPYRAGGFRVEAERLSRRQTVIHNYGHGGAGVTMSWGSAALAVQEALKATDARAFAVLGCGVMGLTTALLLLQAGRAVTIHAEQLPPYTTSNIAAAVWGPSTLFDEAAVDDVFLQQYVYAARVSQRRFQHFAGDSAYGVRWIREYGFRRRAPSGPEEPALYGDDLYPGLTMHADPARWFGFPGVAAYHNIMIDPDIYLRALMDDVLALGGRIVQRRFETVDDVAALNERAVMNCTGLGARDLFGDEALVPVRGQLTMLLPQKEIDYGYVTGTPEGVLYMFPRQSGIVLGGTMQHGEWSTDISAEQRTRMLTGHAEISARIAGG